MKNIILHLTLLLIFFGAPLVSANEKLTSTDILEIKKLLTRIYPKSGPTAPESLVPHSEISPCFFCFSANGYRELFIPSIANLLNKPYDNPNDLIFCLDYGVIITGQDFWITEFHITEPIISPSGVHASAHFKNFGRPEKITFEFQRYFSKLQDIDIWGIKDITSQELQLSRELEICQ